MRILIFHGYLLGGHRLQRLQRRARRRRSRAAGHEVHLLCQDRDPLAHDWVDAAGDWDGGALEVRDAPRAGARDGLPARHRRACCRSTSPTATRASRRARSRSSTTRSSSATSSATWPRCARSPSAVRPDVALANHLVMGPVILARALEGRRARTRSRSTAARWSTPSSRTRSASCRSRARASRAPAACSSARATPPRACGRRWATTALPEPHAARPARRRRRTASRRASPPRRARAWSALRERLGRRPRRGRRDAPRRSSFARRAGEAAEALAHRRARTTGSWCSSAS